MCFRLLFACSLLLTLSACGASSPSMAEGPSAGKQQIRAGKPESPTAEEATGRPSAEFASLTPQAEQAGPDAESGNEGVKEADGTAEEAKNDAASGDPADIVLLARAIAELRTSIDDLREQNRQIMAAVGANKVAADFELDNPAQPSSSADSLVDIVMDLRDTVAVLAAENATFGKLIQEQTTVLKPIPPVPTQGTLLVENNTDGDQYVWINGTGRWVGARTTAKVTVPVGEITTKISGEPQRTWEIKAPDYQEHIEFVQP